MISDYSRGTAGVCTSSENDDNYCNNRTISRSCHFTDIRPTTTWLKAALTAVKTTAQPLKLSVAVAAAQRDLDLHTPLSYSRPPGEMSGNAQAHLLLFLQH